MKTSMLIICTLFFSTIVKAQVAGFKILNGLYNTKPTEQIDSSIRGHKKVFKTIEIIDYNYLSQDKTAIENELKNLENELYENSTGKDGKPFFDQETRNIKSNRIKILKDKSKLIKQKQDSLYLLYTRDYLILKRSTVFSFGKIRSKVFFDFYMLMKVKDLKAWGIQESILEIIPVRFILSS